ncbi:MAG: hypothetical protein DRP11_04870, partial [Candidatus Aenigmatarchaeota archaeon]
MKWPLVRGSYEVLNEKGYVGIIFLPQGARDDEHTDWDTPPEWPEDVAMIGTLQTENEGIKDVILNTMSSYAIDRLAIVGKNDVEMGPLDWESASMHIYGR